jgi:hypothetical protein
MMPPTAELQGALRDGPRNAQVAARLDHGAATARPASRRKDRVSSSDNPPGIFVRNRPDFSGIVPEK